MFTTVASRKAMPEPSTVASRIHRACGVPHAAPSSLDIDTRTLAPPARGIVFEPRSAGQCHLSKSAADDLANGFGGAAARVASHVGAGGKHIG
jgi:hypothetical protein